MNLQQIRLLVALGRHGFNLTEVGAALHIVPSAVSKQLRELESELGVELVVRKGKRLLGYTEPGFAALPAAVRALDEIQNLRGVADDYRDASIGELTLATTHTQARYALPPVIAAFRAQHRQVHLALYQENPETIARMVIEGRVDIGIATESLAGLAEIVTFDFYTWSHRVIVPLNHALASGAHALSLAELARYPLITYHRGFTGRGLIDQRFEAAGLTPDIVLAAMDADVIKTYVALGLGVGLIADVAFDAKRDQGLVSRDCAELTRCNHTRLALKRGRYLRNYVYDFLALCVPGLTREAALLALQASESPD